MSYELSFRKRILEHINEGNSAIETSKLFNVSIYALNKWRRMHKEGSLEDPIRNRNFKKIDPQKLEAYILEKPDAYLSEIAEIFQCSTSSVHKALVKIGFSHKKKDKTYREQDQKK